MKRAPKNTMMTSDDILNKRDGLGEEVVGGKTFYFPSLGKKIKARTYQEALSIINKEQ